SMMANLKQLTRSIIDMDPRERDKSRGVPRRRTAKAISMKRVSKERGQALYLTACSACHSIGMGKRIGPDLEGVAERRKLSWLSQYIMHPSRVRRTGDSIAAELSAAFPGVRMPNLGLSETDAGDVIAYLKAETSRLGGGVQSTNAAGQGQQKRQ
ncbi:MAG: c-type cytochrome, partial [Hyphomicrobiaceae bacterium]